MLFFLILLFSLVKCGHIFVGEVLLSYKNEVFANINLI